MANVAGLAKLVLAWWEDAQYWTEEGWNVFDDVPNFVKEATCILKGASDGG